METETRIYVNNDLDIVLARMQARDVAKKMGFNTADQARVSLATSELARVLSWMTHEPGEIVLSNAHKNGRHGLQVVCLVQRQHVTLDSSNGSVEPSLPYRSLAGACKLVDESIIEKNNGKQAMVTLIKWLK